MSLPCDCDFIRHFVFGDLIYGTTFDRLDYISAAEKLSYTGAKVTLDRLTRQLDTALRGGDGEYVKNKLSEEQFNLLPGSAQNFLQYAQKCTVWWAKMKGIKTAYADYTKYGVAKARPDLGDRKQWSSQYMRAKCRAGIQWVLDSGFTVRFALDSLWDADSMETISRKETGQPWHTGSELRWVFKHRDNPKVQTGVIYYVKGAWVDAPWNVFPESWENFGQTRMEKIPEKFRKDYYGMPSLMSSDTELI